jgi:hypothetical protein
MYKILVLMSLFSFSCVSQDKNIELQDGRGKLLQYNAEYVESPDSTKPWLGRSGFIHPVYSPNGKVLTEKFPKSHPHQHALMFAWTSARIEDRKVDFWNSHQKQGKIEHVETVFSDENKIIVKLNHIDLTGDKPTVVLHETWEISRIPHKNLNIFDLKSVQTCPTEKPFHIAKYHYGAMCVRLTDLWVGDKAKFKSSEGGNRQEANHSRPNWLQMSGEIDGEKCGIVAMQHKENFRYPQPLRIHPKQAYFCFAPMVLGEFKIEPGKPYISQFRFVTFDGEISDEQLQSLWASFNQ